MGPGALKRGFPITGKALQPLVRHHRLIGIGPAQRQAYPELRLEMDCDIPNQREACQSRRPSQLAAFGWITCGVDQDQLAYSSRPRCGEAPGHGATQRMA